ncbi:MAG: twin-arginine translocation signal domain-containing protein [Actinomycetota bacterium]
MTEKNEAGLSRRDALKRVAALGGTLAWAAPAVQTIRVSPAFAQEPSPRPDGHDISFIGLNVECEDESLVSVPYTIKFEGCEGTDCFESDPGKFPSCDFFAPAGEKTDGDGLGFTAVLDPTTRCVTITVPADCEVINSAIKGGQDCCPGPSGTGDLVFCPPNC